jgi:type II secretory pathway pseudopilin PulG
MAVFHKECEACDRGNARRRHVSGTLIPKVPMSRAAPLTTPPECRNQIYDDALMAATAPRAALTLVEVAFSLGIIVIAVVSTMLIFPTGIRAQTSARFKLLAATKAMEMMEWYRDGSIGGTINDGNDLDKEGVMPWDSIVTYRSFAPDLDCAIDNMRGGFKPLPMAIARRLDSDGDEIADVLNQGGYVYYCAPAYLNGFLDGPLATSDQNWLSETSKIIIAVVGYPQQNSILYHPSLKVGPYQDFYPSPPSYVNETLWAQPNQPLGSAFTAGFIDLDALCRDPDIAEVMASTCTYPKPDGSRGRFGYKDYLGATNVDTDATVAPPDPTAAKLAARAYVVAALWYADHVGLAQGTANDPSAIVSKSAMDGFVAANQAATCWKRVLAMRYLAHAADCLTRQFDLATLQAGVDLSDLAFTDPGSGASFLGGIVTLDLVKAWHETAIRLAVAHADTAGPYHWGAPRPLNRQVMMDHPLCQLDLWSQPISAPIPAVGGGTTICRQWRACYPQPIRVPGASFSYPGRLRDTNGDGVIDQRDNDNSAPYAYPQRKMDVGSGGVVTGPGLAEAAADGVLDENDRPVPAAPSPLGVDTAHGIYATVPGGWQPALGPSSHFNLTLPFEPRDRCRQIVVWAVDWQSYEDYETAPSAPLDASRYPIVAPYPTRTSSAETAWSTSWVQRNALDRENDAWYRSGVLFSECIRNPEHVFLFRLPSTIAPNGPAKTTPVLTISDINNFGGGVDYGNATTSPVNETNPTCGESPDMSTPQGSIGAPAFPAPDDARLSWNRKILLGRYGANRNGVTVGQLTGVGASLNDPPPDVSRYYATGKVDTGTLPASMRLRATTVCRFNYYDSRVSGCQHN